jgi:hypothetical protein
MRPQLWFRAVQVGTQCPVQAEHGAGGETPFPEHLAVFEAGDVKANAPRISMPPEMAMIESGARRWQVRTGRR